MDDEPTTKRGAGWDDDEDWQRRDLGPRPDVPNHGARPFLMGIPILLITIAAIVAIVISSGGDDDKGASSGSGAGSGSAAAGSAGGPVAEVQQAIASKGQLIAGLSDAAVVKSATCKEGSAAGTYACSYGDGKKGGRTMTIEYSSGTLSKRLSGKTTATTAADPKAVAALLASDDAAAVGGAQNEYACATSVGLNADGSPMGGNTQGYLCVQTQAGGDAAVQRFVAFADDGSVTSDYALGGA